MPDNDPCRALGSGWRLPTQEEWELLGNYNCDPAVASASFPVHADSLSVVPPIPSGGVLSPFTWVRVSCNEGRCWSSDVSTWAINPATRNGFVLYLTEVLGDFPLVIGETNLLADDAPEPFLFLPAAGWRDVAGSVNNVGTHGNYWSSTFSNVFGSRGLRFSSSDVGAGIIVGDRAVGMSVRCVRD